MVHYNITYTTGDVPVKCVVQLLDRNKNVVADNEEVMIETNEIDGNSVGTFTVPQANLWWPYLMHSDPGYLYSLEVRNLLWNS